MSHLQIKIEAPDSTQDICKFCKKSITYDKEDGYWDSIDEIGNYELSRKDGNVTYTPFCGNEDDGKLHEPLNFTSGEGGLYYYNVTTTDPVFPV